MAYGLPRASLNNREIKTGDSEVFTTRQKPKQADVAVVTAKIVEGSGRRGRGSVMVMNNL